MTAPHPIGVTPHRPSTGKTPRTTNGQVKPQDGAATRVPLTEVRLDSGYQRDLDTARVNRLVSDYDPQLAGALILSARAGSLWCVDGQHRMAAMNELGLSHANAVVFEGLTQRAEADLFIRYNRNRKGLTAWDWFKAELVAGHEEAHEITRIVNLAGFRITQEKGVTHIQAVNGIRRIYRLGSEALLAMTLVAVRRNWSGDKDALSGQVLEGLAIFYHSFRAEPQYDAARVDSILDAQSPTQLKRRAQEIAAERTINGISSVNLAEAIRNAYNVRLSVKKRLGAVRKVNRVGTPRTR